MRAQEVIAVLDRPMLTIVYLVDRVRDQMRRVVDGIQDDAVDRVMTWVCNGRLASLPAALAVAAFVRREAPEGIPVGEFSKFGCDYRLHIQPRISGPRMVVTCRICEQAREYVSVADIDQAELETGCPIRSVLGS